MKPQDYLNLKQTTWCPGCAGFSVQNALAKAMIELDIKPHQIAMVFDIGCVGNACSLWKTYSFHGIHGRTLPVAIGAKLANHQLTVIGMAGDGGAYGEGPGHLIEAARANYDITFVVGNNRLYSLTKGQASPTIEKGTKTKSTPYGVLKTPVDPLTLAISSDASFVARGYSDRPEHLKDIFKKAINHKGFSLVDVYQPCITLDKKHTRDWYQERIYELDKKWPTQDKARALKLLIEENKKIPIGIIYQKERPSYQSQIEFLKKDSLIQQPKTNQLKELTKEFK